jgi:hypothetical protein
MMSANNIHYELADGVQGLAAGAIGAMYLLVHKIGLVRDIDHNLMRMQNELPRLTGLRFNLTGRLC